MWLIWRNSIIFSIQSVYPRNWIPFIMKGNPGTCPHSRDDIAFEWLVLHSLWVLDRLPFNFFTDCSSWLGIKGNLHYVSFQIISHRIVVSSWMFISSYSHSSFLIWRNRIWISSRWCWLKNLSSRSHLYVDEDCQYFYFKVKILMCLCPLLLFQFLCPYGFKSYEESSETVSLLHSVRLINDIRDSQARFLIQDDDKRLTEIHIIETYDVSKDISSLI